MKTYNLTIEIKIKSKKKKNNFITLCTFMKKRRNDLRKGRQNIITLSCL